MDRAEDRGLDPSTQDNSLTGSVPVGWTSETDMSTRTQRLTTIIRTSVLSGGPREPPNMSQHVPTSPNMSQHVPTCPNLQTLSVLNLDVRSVVPGDLGQVHLT